MYSDFLDKMLVIGVYGVVLSVVIAVLGIFVQSMLPIGSVLFVCSAIVIIASYLLDSIIYLLK